MLTDTKTATAKLSVKVNSSDRRCTTNRSTTTYYSDKHKWPWGLVQTPDGTELKYTASGYMMSIYEIIERESLWLTRSIKPACVEPEPKIGHPPRDSPVDRTSGPTNRMCAGRLTQHYICWKSLLSAGTHIERITATYPAPFLLSLWEIMFIHMSKAGYKKKETRDQRTSTKHTRIHRSKRRLWALIPQTASSWREVREP